MEISDDSIDMARRGLAMVLAFLDELEAEADQDGLVLARFSSGVGSLRKRESEKDYLVGLLRDARGVAKRSFSEFGGTSAELKAVRKLRQKVTFDQLARAYLKATPPEGKA